MKTGQLQSDLQQAAAVMIAQAAQMRALKGAAPRGVPDAFPIGVIDAVGLDRTADDLVRAAMRLQRVAKALGELRLRPDVAAWIDDLT